MLYTCGFWFPAGTQHWINIYQHWINIISLNQCCWSKFSFGLIFIQQIHTCIKTMDIRKGNKKHAWIQYKDLNGSLRPTEFILFNWIKIKSALSYDTESVLIQCLLNVVCLSNVVWPVVFKILSWRWINVDLIFIKCWAPSGILFHAMLIICKQEFCHEKQWTQSSLCIYAV